MTSVAGFQRSGGDARGPVDFISELSDMLKLCADLGNKEKKQDFFTPREVKSRRDRRNLD